MRGGSWGARWVRLNTCAGPGFGGIRNVWGVWAHKHAHETTATVQHCSESLHSWQTSGIRFRAVTWKKSKCGRSHFLEEKFEVGFKLFVGLRMWLFLQGRGFWSHVDIGQSFTRYDMIGSSAKTSRTSKMGLDWSYVTVVPRAIRSGFHLLRSGFHESPAPSIVRKSPAPQSLNSETISSCMTQLETSYAETSVHVPIKWSHMPEQHQQMSQISSVSVISQNATATFSTVTVCWLC